METVKLTGQQSLRIAELPADYRVVGIDHSAPLVRKPSGQLLRIQPNGRLVAATLEARRNLEHRASETTVLPHGATFATPYTEVLE
jgi:hypothetical protein